jgi:membrane fusion protein, copper/silver efflux system
VTPGSRVDVHLPAYPNEKLSGRVSAILPEVNAATRTLRARVEVSNPGGRLKPGMYANVDFSPRARDALIVPSDSVIRTGTRDVVIVAEGGGRFHPAEVQIGTETAGSTEILKGLKAGDRVVVSGQFLIDSEASLRTTLDRMKGAPAEGEPAAPKVEAGASPAAPVLHRATGKVVAVDGAKGHVELEHGAIPTLKWPPMTMGFVVSDKAALARIRKGDTVEFELNGKPNAQGDYVIARIAPSGARR